MSDADQEQPRPVVPLHYAPVSRRIPPIVWISAGMAVVLSIGLAVLAPLLLLLAGRPAEPDNPGGIFSAALAFVEFACLCALVAEFFSLVGRSRRATVFVILYLVLYVCPSIYAVLEMVRSRQVYLPALQFHLGLVATGLIAIAGHIVWFGRIRRM
jgi:hypothetical protein